MKTSVGDSEDGAPRRRVRSEFPADVEDEEGVRGRGDGPVLRDLRNCFSWQSQPFPLLDLSERFVCPDTWSPAELEAFPRCQVFFGSGLNARHLAGVCWTLREARSGMTTFSNNVSAFFELL